jgi:hypothetical protein
MQLPKETIHSIEPDWGKPYTVSRVHTMADPRHSNRRLGILADLRRLVAVFADDARTLRASLTIEIQGERNMNEGKDEGNEKLVWVKDRAGNEFLCPVDALRDPAHATEDELKGCIDIVDQEFGSDG